MAMSGARSRNACATPLTILVAPGPRVDMQMPGLPVISPHVEASMAPATSCFISRNRIWRWRAASISSTDSPPGCPTMKGVPASLNAVASTSTVVDIRHPPGIRCNGSLEHFFDQVDLSLCCHRNFPEPQFRSNGTSWRRYTRIVLHARAGDERRRQSDLVYRDPLCREYFARRHRKVGRRVALPRGAGVRLRDGPFGHALRARASLDRGGAISGARRT